MTQAMTYVCQGCKQSVHVYVRAAVTCSRCGRRMRAQDDGHVAPRPS